MYVNEPFGICEIQCHAFKSDRLWQQAEELADADVPFLYVACPQDNYLVRDGLTIPPLGRVKSRNQGGAGLENLNEWSWSE